MLLGMLPSVNPDLVDATDVPPPFGSPIIIHDEKPDQQSHQAASIPARTSSASPTSSFLLPFATPMLARVPTASSDSVLDAGARGPLSPPSQLAAWDDAALAVIDELRDEQLGVLFELSRLVRDAALCKPAELRGHRSLAGFLTEIEPAFASQLVDTLFDKVCQVRGCDVSCGPTTLCSAQVVSLLSNKLKPDNVSSPASQPVEFTPQVCCLFCATVRCIYQRCCLYCMAGIRCLVHLYTAAC
jgi:hypothetical protein